MKPKPRERLQQAGISQQRTEQQVLPYLPGQVEGV